MQYVVQIISILHYVVYIGYVVQIISIIHRIKSDPNSEMSTEIILKNTVFSERLQLKRSFEVKI
jgi:hypothetical protein